MTHRPYGSIVPNGSHVPERYARCIVPSFPPLRGERYRNDSVDPEPPAPSFRPTGTIRSPWNDPWKGIAEPPGRLEAMASAEVIIQRARESASRPGVVRVRQRVGAEPTRRSPLETPPYSLAQVGGGL